MLNVKYRGKKTGEKIQEGSQGMDAWRFDGL